MCYSWERLRSKIKEIILYQVILPLKVTTSPDGVFGKPLKQASDVNATETPRLPRRKPIACPLASYITPTDSIAVV